MYQGLIIRHSVLRAEGNKCLQLEGYKETR